MSSFCSKMLQRFESQTDLGRNPTCHFTKVPLGASDFTSLSSDLFSVRWRIVVSVPNVIVLQLNEIMHAKLFVFQPDGIKMVHCFGHHHYYYFYSVDS